MTDLLTRLLALAELAVDAALEFDYGDPEDRHIYRELQELKPLVATALAQPEPEELTDQEIEREAIANADTDGEYSAFKIGAFFVQERMNRTVIKPVPVTERLPGPEDTTDRNECWYWHPGEECWEMVPVVTHTVDEWTHWLPHHALPVPEVTP